MNGKSDMLHLALMVVHDECPPDNRMYLCRMGEEPESRCEECWSNYLLWASNGYQEKYEPYRFCRNRG